MKSLVALTWNCEGIKQNIFALKDVLADKSADLVFLSEPQVFKSDITAILSYLQGEYCYNLNSEDVYNPELPLTKNYSSGGTLCLWRKWLDPYVSVHPCQIPSFTPLLLKLPGYQVSIHIGLYLPTHGKDSEFVSDLADLAISIQELADMYLHMIISH